MKNRAEAFRHQSFSYYEFEDLQDAEKLRDDEQLILLSSAGKGSRQLLWAAADPDVIVQAARELDEAVALSFVPDGFIAALTAAGFSIYAEYDDYFNEDIAATCTGFGLNESSKVYMTQSTNQRLLQGLVEISSGPSRGFDAEPTEWYRDWLKENSILVVSEENRPVGYCCVGRYADVVWVRRLAVDTGYQGRGLGRELLGQALLYGLQNGAKRGFLHVDRSNKTAISLYGNFGFAARDGSGERIMIRKKGLLQDT